MYETKTATRAIWRGFSLVEPFDRAHGKLPVVREGKTKGFTLIELLVVISIISLLVTIILPSLERAKDLAREVTCLTNQHAVASAMLLYAADNDDRPPNTADWDTATAKYLEVSLPIDVRQWNRETMPAAFFCPVDPDPYPRPYMDFLGDGIEVTSWFVNGVYKDKVEGSGAEVFLGIFGGKFSMDDIPSTASCMMIGESTSYSNIADLDHPAAEKAFAAGGGDISWGRTRYHHRATSGFFHNRKMNVTFVDGHGASVEGRQVDPLPPAQWPGGAVMDPSTAFYPALSLPTAEEEPIFWGPPYNR